MPSQHEIETKFWDALKSDMTVMLGLTGSVDVFPHPMTAQLEASKGPIWFFSATDNDMVKTLHSMQPALFTFASKGHDLFATVQGKLVVDNDRAVIDRLWNKYVAAWFEKGKDDPKLALLRFDPGHAEIWLDEKSLFAGIKVLFGVDPKKGYKDKIAEVDLG
ncbi:MAG: ral stress protein [Rhizobium sp.]|nr:ral stress protein [Rhizobium sp.]